MRIAIATTLRLYVGCLATVKFHQQPVPEPDPMGLVDIPSNLPKNQLFFMQVVMCLHPMDPSDLKSHIVTIWVFPKILVPPIIHFNRVFHYKPSILG